MLKSSQLLALTAACLLSTLTAAQERAMLTNADFERAMDVLSNWGRWGAEDELGQANFITPAKRLQAAALVTEGISVSLAHDVVQGAALEEPDTSAVLNRQVLRVGPGGASDS